MLSGGELAAAIVIDSVARLLPGALVVALALYHVRVEVAVQVFVDEGQSVRKGQPLAMPLGRAADYDAGTVLVNAGSPKEQP